MSCEKSTTRLRSSSSMSSCYGSINLYSGIEARALGFLRAVYLCKYHSQSSRNESKDVCCFPLPGACSKTFRDCPARLLEVFDTLSPVKISTQICILHFKEVDKLEVITSHPLYKKPKERKVMLYTFFL